MPPTTPKPRTPSFILLWLMTAICVQASPWGVRSLVKFLGQELPPFSFLIPMMIVGSSLTGGLVLLVVLFSLDWVKPAGFKALAIGLVGWGAFVQTSHFFLSQGGFSFRTSAAILVFTGLGVLGMAVMCGLTMALLPRVRRMGIAAAVLGASLVTGLLGQGVFRLMGIASPGHLNPLGTILVITLYALPMALLLWFVCRHESSSPPSESFTPPAP